MRVLLAPDSFSGTLTAAQAAHALAAGWRRHAPRDVLDLCPLSDGGPGFVEVLRTGLSGRLEAVTVPGPLGAPVPAALLIVDDGAARTAYVESAQACGLHLVPAGQRAPGRATTRGVGLLLRAARDAGATRVVVGLGGSGTNDAGAGMLAGLLMADGADPADPVDPVVARLAGGGEALRGLVAADLGALADLPRAWADVGLVVASDLDVGLLGFHGTSAGYAEAKGATPEQAQALERCLGDFAAAATAALGVDAKVTSVPGAGADGGLGFALLLLGATRVPGAAAVADAVGLAERVRAADLVVTGEGCFDWQSLRGRVVAEVARAALDVGTPAVVVAGQVLVGRREAQTIGVESAYPVARTPAEVEAALTDPAGTLAARAERVARTWSR